MELKLPKLSLFCFEPEEGGLNYGQIYLTMEMCLTLAGAGYPGMWLDFLTLDPENDAAEQHEARWIKPDRLHAIYMAMEISIINRTMQPS